MLEIGGRYQAAKIDDLSRTRLVAAFKCSCRLGVAGSAMTPFKLVLSRAEIAADTRFLETEFLLSRATMFGKHDGRPRNSGTKIASSVAVTQVK